MERLFFRERQYELERENSRVEQWNIGVTGLGRSMGTTFVATALAFYFQSMGKNVTFVQCLTPSHASGLLYDSVAMDQRFAHRTFHDPYLKIAKEESVRDLGNLEEGIRWMIPSGKAGDLTEQQRSRLIHGARGELCIFDLEADSSWDGFMMDMDLLIVVTDPLPSKLIHHVERFKRLKKMELSGTTAVWVVNRCNDGVNKRQVKGFLKNNQLVWIPSFGEESFYQCEYACKFLWENKEIQRKMLEIFTKVSQLKPSL
ncbi:MAG: hypothetical protein IKU44_05310 [Firmicutes bacterium]|nr:hypothetical protein [Bacillota bacterium]